MTPGERRNPDILKASRKRRIAAGSGTKPEDINRLLKMHRTMADVMKAMGGAKRGPMAGPRQYARHGRRCAEPGAMAELAKKMRAALPPGMPAGRPAAGNAGPARRIFPECRVDCPDLVQKFPGGLPGLGKKK